MPDAEAQTDAPFDASAEIDRLHAEVALLTEECRSRAAWRDQAERERDRIREALRPFVEGSRFGWPNAGQVTPWITLEQWREAVECLKPGTMAGSDT